MSALLDPLQYPFMRSALLEVLLLSVASGLVGVFVVHRQLTFFSHALSQTMLPALVLAAALQLDLAIGAIVGAAASVILIFVLGRHREIGHSGAVGVVFIELFAAGVVLMGIFRVKSPDVGASLIGDVLGISAEGLLLSVGLVAGLALTMRLLFWSLVLSTFDPGAARAAGLPAGLLSLVLLAMVASTAIIGVRVVGAILTIAVLVVPAAAALRWTRHVRRAMVLSGVVAAAAGVLGLYVSYYAPIAPSAVMVLALAASFAISVVLAPGRFAGRALRARTT